MLFEGAAFGFEANATPVEYSTGIALGVPLPWSKA